MKVLAVGLTGQDARFDESERSSGGRKLPTHEEANRAAFVNAESNNAARFAMGAITRWSSARMSPLSRQRHFARGSIIGRTGTSQIFPGDMLRSRDRNDSRNSLSVLAMPGTGLRVLALDELLSVAGEPSAPVWGGLKSDDEDKGGLSFLFLGGAKQVSSLHMPSANEW